MLIKLTVMITALIYSLLYTDRALGSDRIPLSPQPLRGPASHSPRCCMAIGSPAAFSSTGSSHTGHNPNTMLGKAGTTGKMLLLCVRDQRPGAVTGLAGDSDASPICRAHCLLILTPVI